MGQKVLIVEDEPNITASLVFLLDREGFEVTVEADGAAAMGQIETAEPDLVILDVMLPNVSGFDILRHLRAHPALGRTPVMMLTAKGQSRDRERAEELGADRFVTKPYSNREIIEWARQLAAI
ncbi:MAG: response regulator [Pseudomonadota bacterium]